MARRRSSGSRCGRRKNKESCTVVLFCHLDMFALKIYLPWHTPTAWISRFSIFILIDRYLGNLFPESLTSYSSLSRCHVQDYIFPRPVFPRVKSSFFLSLPFASFLLSSSLSLPPSYNQNPPTCVKFLLSHITTHPTPYMALSTSPLTMYQSALRSANS